MSFPNPKKNLNWIVKDLLKGQESAHQLRNLINGPDEAKKFVGEILDIFSTVLSALQTSEEAGLIESADQKSQISNRKRKGFDGSDQRSNSRRRIRQADTRVVMANTIEDGQAWRKYGQKGILNSKNPRSYFRCTHKFDQGCKAQKQAQKSEENPTIFIITYMGNHTCKSSSPLPPIVPTSSLNNSSCIISFESKPGQGNIVSTSFPSVKQDSEEEVLSNLTIADLTAGADLDPIAPIPVEGADRGDVTSGLSCSNEDLDMHLSWAEFDDLASFCDLIQ